MRRITIHALALFMVGMMRLSAQDFSPRDRLCVDGACATFESVRAYIVTNGASGLTPIVAQGTFHNCGIEGDAKAARVRPLNRLKNRAELPAPSALVDLDLGKLYAPGNDEDRFDVNTPVRFRGWVTDVKVGGIETVNCHARDPFWRDTHIEVRRSLDDTAHPVIVEVTPRWRVAMQAVGIDWTTAALRRELIGHLVEFEGWPLFDAEHERQADTTDPGGRGNWRETAWEPAHPVTKIQVIR